MAKYTSTPTLSNSPEVMLVTIDDIIMQQEALIVAAETLSWRLQSSMSASASPIDTRMHSALNCVIGMIGDTAARIRQQCETGLRVIDARSVA